MGINERKEREKQKRRDDILDAAEKVFFTRGIENSTMDDVAEEAELSKGTLYLYFKSKEEIHWEISQRHMDKIQNDMEKACDKSKNAVENLLAIAEVFIDHFNKEHAVAHSILFFQSSDLSKLNLNQDQICKAFLEDSPIHLVQKLVEEGIREGLIRDDIPANALGSTLWAQLMGVLQIVIMKQELFELINVRKEDILQSHIKIALNGVLKHEKT
jgi:TetR/AcrR family transcriptional regulator